MSHSSQALTQLMNQLLRKADGQDITLEIALQHLSRKGYATLLVLLSIPFCLPLQVPGTSLPLGLTLALIGLRIAFGKRIWLPQRLLQKKISYAVLKKVSSWTLTIVHKFRFLTATRLVWFSQTQSARIFNGLLIAFLSVLLALPIPLPVITVAAAFPNVLFGLGMLEDDGIFILIAYLFSALGIVFYAWLLWFGPEELMKIFYYWYHQ